MPRYEAEVLRYRTEIHTIVERTDIVVEAASPDAVRQIIFQYAEKHPDGNALGDAPYEQIRDEEDDDGGNPVYEVTEIVDADPNLEPIDFGE